MCGEARATTLALAGGEDYALLFTAPARLREALDGLACRIGECGDGEGIGAYLAGRPVPVPDHGYDHFASETDV